MKNGSWQQGLPLMTLIELIDLMKALSPWPLALSKPKELLYQC